MIGASATAMRALWTSVIMPTSALVKRGSWTPETMYCQRYAASTVVVDGFDLDAAQRTAADLDEIVRIGRGLDSAAMPSTAPTSAIKSSTAASRACDVSFAFSRTHSISSRIACCDSSRAWYRNTSFQSSDTWASVSMLSR